MENAGVTSEASVRRPKKARVLDSSDGGPSKSSGSNPEKNDRVPADGEQLSGDEGDGDWLLDGSGNRSPKARRKRGPSAKVVGAMEDWKLIDEYSKFIKIQEASKKSPSITALGELDESTSSALGSYEKEDY